MLNQRPLGSLQNSPLLRGVALAMLPVLRTCRGAAQSLLGSRLTHSASPSGDHSCFQIGTDFFILGKLQSHAPIDEATNNHHYLGIEPDVYINWQVSSDVTVALRYGVFVPSSRNFQSHDARQFLYATVTYGF